MKGRTHAITGGLIVAVVSENSSVFSNPHQAAFINTISLMTIGAMGALLPDIDRTDTMITHLITRNNSNSRLVQNILKISILILMGFLLSIFVSENNYPLILGVYLSLVSLTPHRTITHTLLSLGIVVGLMFLITNNTIIIIALGLGYAVHLLEDTLTDEGTPLLFPLCMKNIRIPIVTSKLAEYIFLIVVSVSCILKMVRF